MLDCEVTLPFMLSINLKLMIGEIMKVNEIESFNYDYYIELAKDIRKIAEE